MKKLQKGFTLIELMIAVAIIAILAGVGAPKFGQQIKKAKDAKGLAVVGNWRSAINLEYVDSETYETTFSAALQNTVDKRTLGATIFQTRSTKAKVEVGTSAKATQLNSKPAIFIKITGNTTSGTAVEIDYRSGVDTKGTTWSAY